MGLFGLFYFGLKCFKLLAWPSFALGYPLCASIQAIETNCNYHMRKMVTYWIIFSLICLFEHTFSGLLQWLPVWPYAKVLAIFCLVIPGFDGAIILYDTLVSPCVSAQLLQVLDLLNKNQNLSLEGKSFLVVAQRYVDEHGTEALEKLISLKPNNTEPTFPEADIKEAESLNESSAPAENKTTAKLNANVEVQNMTLPSPLEENVQTSLPNFLSQTTAKLNSNAEVQNMTLPSPLEENVQTSLPNFLSQTTAKLNCNAEVQNMTLPSPLEENVQREWTCAVCLVTTNNKATLNSHLLGKKHRTRCKELKAGKQTTEKVVTVGGPNRVRYCTICQVKTQSEEAWNSHVQGKKHKSKCKELKAIVKEAKNNNFLRTATKSYKANEDSNKASFNGGPSNKITSANIDPKRTSSNGGLNYSFSCDICEVMVQSEVTLRSHLRGKKHKLKSEELKAREMTKKDINESSRAITTSSAVSANVKNGGLNNSDGQNNNKLHVDENHSNKLQQQDGPLPISYLSALENYREPTRMTFRSNPDGSRAAQVF